MVNMLPRYLKFFNGVTKWQATAPSKCFYNALFAKKSCEQAHKVASTVLSFYFFLQKQ